MVKTFMGSLIAALILTMSLSAHARLDDQDQADITEANAVDVEKCTKCVQMQANINRMARMEEEMALRTHDRNVFIDKNTIINPADSSATSEKKK